MSNNYVLLYTSFLTLIVFLQERMNGMNDSLKTSLENTDSLIDTREKDFQCNESLWNLFPHNEVCSATDLIEDKETYLERSLGFLIVGFTGILSNLVTIYVLGSSVKI